MATDIELVRALIPDTDKAFGASGDEYLFEDADIQNYLDIASGNVLRAAAYAMIAVGNSEALIGKVIKTADLSTDASKLQDKWRESGQALLDRADKEDVNEASNYFQIVDYKEGWGVDRAELTEYGLLWA